MPLPFALLALATPTPTQKTPTATPAQIEKTVLSIVADDTGDKDAEDAIRKGAHLLATRDLSELTDAMKDAEKVMKDALKDVDPASLKALKAFVAKAPR